MAAAVPVSAPVAAATRLHVTGVRAGAAHAADAGSLFVLVRQVVGEGRQGR